MPVRLALRPRRKRVSIELKAHSPITVRGPLSLSRRQAERFLLEKWTWIEEHWAELAKVPKPTTLDFSSGDTSVWVHGKKWLLKRSVTPLRKTFLATDSSGAPVLYMPERKRALTPEQSKKIWRDFLGNECRRELLPVLLRIAREMSVRPVNIRFKYMRSRWGSCSSKGMISLNSNLASAPLWVAEAVIVHELAHLRHMNHGREFWAFVRAHAPRCKDADRWLATHSPEFP